MLEVRGLNAGYGRAQVLFDLVLEVSQGEVVALLGRNGAGKSTTLKAIMGLVEPLSGDIVFDGKPLNSLEPYQIARLGVGYVPEDRRIFTDLTVTENLEVARPRPRGAAQPWSEERLFALFPALASMRERRGSCMSGGEQQMLCIARTLSGNPSAILLDEPSEGLAPLVVAQVTEAIREIRRAGVAVLLAEQSRHFTDRVADRAYVLEKGVISRG